MSSEKLEQLRQSLARHDEDQVITVKDLITIIDFLLDGDYVQAMIEMCDESDIY